MTALLLPHAVRSLAARLALVGADVVEVMPTAIGSADLTPSSPTGSPVRSSPASPSADAPPERFAVRPDAAGPGSAHDALPTLLSPGPVDGQDRSRAIAAKAIDNAFAS
jgi:hypothetical protein